LYLFVCGLSWRKQDNASAGWELVRCLKAPGRTGRIAASFLGQTKNIQLPVREVERARDGPGKPGLTGEPATLNVSKVVATLNTPYGLEIIENCVTCRLRKDKWFCGLSSDVLKAFSAASHLSTYPGGAILFVEGQTPRELWCSARAESSSRPPLAMAKC
jgi:hypothetical protein